MSDPEQREPSDQDWTDDQIEKHLRGLVPSSPKADFFSEMNADYGRIQESKRRSARSATVSLSKRVAIMTVGSFALTFGFLQLRDLRPASTELTNTASSSPTVTIPRLSDRPLNPVVSERDGFQPVSAQEYLIDSSSKGLLRTGHGAVEKRELHFRDAYHWHDPKTQTNIRYFVPRAEEVLVPVEVD